MIVKSSGSATDRAKTAPSSGCPSITSYFPLFVSWFTPSCSSRADREAHAGEVAGARLREREHGPELRAPRDAGGELGNRVDVAAATGPAALSQGDRPERGPGTEPAIEALDGHALPPERLPADDPDGESSGGLRLAERDGRSLPDRDLATRGVVPDCSHGRGNRREVPRRPTAAGSGCSPADHPEEVLAAVLRLNGYLLSFLTAVDRPEELHRPGPRGDGRASDDRHAFGLDDQPAELTLRAGEHLRRRRRGAEVDARVDVVAANTGPQLVLRERSAGARERGRGVRDVQR